MSHELPRFKRERSRRTKPAGCSSVPGAWASSRGLAAEHSHPPSLTAAPFRIRSVVATGRRWPKPRVYGTSGADAPSPPTLEPMTAAARNEVRIIGGAWRGRKIRFPADVPGLRPTPDRVRETVFNWLPRGGPRQPLPRSLRRQRRAWSRGAVARRARSRLRRPPPASRPQSRRHAGCLRQRCRGRET